MKQLQTLILALLGLTAAAADFTPGYTFSDVESDPNNLVTSNTLAQLVANASARTNLITGRTEATLSATNFYLLCLSTNGTLMKVAVGNLNPSNSITGAQLASNSIPADRIVSGSLTWTNLHTNWLDGLPLYSNLLVNLSTNGPGTNTFLLSGFSYNTGTNGYPTNVQFRLTPLASLTETASFSNTVAALAFTAVTNYPATNRFTSLDYPLSAAQIVNTNHNLGVTPAVVNWVVVCNTADAGYTTNDEVQVWCVSHGDKQAFASGANSTNVFLSLQSTSGLVIAGKDGTASTTFTASRWKARGYARP